MGEADTGQLAELYAVTFNQNGVQEHWTKQTASRLLVHCLSKQPDLCFMALVNDQLVGGFLACIKLWCDGNYLVDGKIFVNKTYQN